MCVVGLLGVLGVLGVVEVLVEVLVLSVLVLVLVPVLPMSYTFSTENTSNTPTSRIHNAIEYQLEKFIFKMSLNYGKVTKEANADFTLMDVLSFY